ncbi:unnamed protein product [Auanema sp. JU1783]|nr:unnamed protein product [Auanema sp. JU1783]
MNCATCCLKVSIFILYVVSLLFCIFGLTNNGWLVIKTENATFQIGLNDNCIVGNTEAKIECAPWSEPEKFRNEFPVDPTPSSTLLLLNRIKWAPPAFVLVCIIACIISELCMKSSLEEIFKTQVVIVSFLVVGALCYIWVLALTYYIHFKADDLFEFTSESYNVEIGKAIGWYWASFAFYVIAILLYVVMLNKDKNTPSCISTQSQSTPNGNHEMAPLQGNPQ